jgi:hypothetical protein
MPKGCRYRQEQFTLLIRSANRSNNDDEFSALCKAQVVGITGLATANQTRLLGYTSDVITVSKPARLDAHAWLDAAGVEVTGYPVANTCTEIACFVWRRNRHEFWFYRENFERS